MDVRGFIELLESQKAPHLGSTWTEWTCDTALHGATRRALRLAAHCLGDWSANNTPAHWKIVDALAGGKIRQPCALQERAGSTCRARAHSCVGSIGSAKAGLTQRGLPPQWVRHLVSATPMPVETGADLDVHSMRSPCSAHVLLLWWITTDNVSACFASSLRV